MKFYFELVLLIALAFAMFQGTVFGQCEKSANKDVRGLAMVHFHNKKEEDCCAICKNEPGCPAYAWSTFEGGTCWLKRGTTLFTKDGVSAGILRLSGEGCLTYENKDVVGNNLDSVSDKQESECCTLCEARSDCNSYAWSDFEGGTCWLKAGTELFDKRGVRAGLVTKNRSGSKLINNDFFHVP